MPPWCMVNAQEKMGIMLDFCALHAEHDLAWRLLGELHAAAAGDLAEVHSGAPAVAGTGQSVSPCLPQVKLLYNENHC